MGALSGLSGLSGLSAVMSGDGYNPATDFNVALLIAGPEYCFTDEAGTTAAGENDPILCWTATNGKKFTKASASGFTLAKENDVWVAVADGTGYLRATTGALGMQTALTMAAIIKPATPGTNEQMVVMFGDESVGERRSIWIADATSYLNFNGFIADATSTTALSADTWVTATITKTSGNLVTIYKDGTSIGSATPSLNNYASDAITIGANNAGGEHYDGKFRVIALKNAVMSAGEKVSWDNYAAAQITALGA